MELKAVVEYKGALAHYSLSPENFGVYQARLLKYEGDPDCKPPQHVLLAKSVRNWAGSCDQRELLNNLGAVIETRMSHRGSGSPDSQNTRGSSEINNR
jgi:hypothetical protein